MKICSSFLLVIITMLFSSRGASQQFVQEWEFPDWLTYVGDIDGDRVGEFIKDDRANSVTTFYDGATHGIKWTITGKKLIGEIFDAEKSNLHPPYLRFPSIDYNGDGKREVLFEPSDGKGFLIVDVVNNTVLFNWTNSTINWTRFEALSDVDGDGALEIVFQTGTDGVGYKTYVYSTGIQITSAGESSETTPESFSLSQNFPNPFNPATNIQYELSKGGDTRIEIFDINGRLVQWFNERQQTPGLHTILWDGKSNTGATVAAGTYFYRLVVDGSSLAKKMILLK